MGSILPIFLVCFLVFFVLLCVLTFRVPSCDIRYSFHIKRCSVLLCLQLFVGGLMSYLCYLCLFANSGIQHILSCVFLRLVYPMLLVSLDCPFLIAPSVFCNVYLYLFLKYLTSLFTFHYMYSLIQNKNIQSL